MELLLGMFLREIEVFFLIFVRMTGLFVVAPVFGRRNIPVYLKIGFSFLTAMIMVNVVPVGNVDYAENAYQLAFMIILEFLAGVTIGYVAYIVFSSIYLAGQLIDMQIGFGMVNVMDPVSNVQIPITANFYFITSTIAFLVVNGHHLLIKALFESYTVIPVGAVVFGDELLNDIIRVFGSVFILGFKIAAPITAAILISDVALGIASRAIPQLNVFVVGMPMKIAVGIGVMLLTIPVFIMLLEALFDIMDIEMINFMRHMAPK